MELSLTHDSVIIKDIAHGKYTMTNKETGIQLPLNVDITLQLTFKEAKELAKALVEVIPNLIVREIKVEAKTSFTPGGEK